MVDVRFRPIADIRNVSRARANLRFQPLAPVSLTSLSAARLLGLMQRKLTAELAEQARLQTVSFRDFDCLIFSRGETLKMFCPSSQRVMMGSPRDLRVTGHILVVFEDDLKRLRPPSKRFEYPEPIFAADIGNFSGFTLRSGIVDGSVDPIFIARLGKLLDALPNDRAGWQKTFGEDFFALSFLGRFEKGVDFLRKAVAFHDPPSRDDIQFEISITDSGE